MDRPKPRIITNVASLIMNKFINAKIAVQVAAAEKRHEVEADINNRATRRWRSKYNWGQRKTFGKEQPGGSAVLRGYFKKYSNSLTFYQAEQNLRPNNTANGRRRDRKNDAKRVKAVNSAITQINQKLKFARSHTH